MPSDPVEAAALESPASSVLQVASGARKAAHGAAVLVYLPSQSRASVELLSWKQGHHQRGAALPKSMTRATPAAQDEANVNITLEAKTDVALSDPLEAAQSLVAPPMARTVAPTKVPSAKFMARRAVEVPTGKLGIVIENRIDGGHEVVEVKEASPLVSWRAEGDIIVSVNGVDTTTMSTAALTALMNRSSRSERTLVVLSAIE